MTTTSSRASVAHLPPPAPGLRLRMTYEEYRAWAPETMFAEWANGEAEVAMSATDLHQRVVALLHLLLGTFVTLRGWGEVRTGPLEVKLWPGTGPAREPDIFVVRRDHLTRLGPDRLAGAPDLAVEVISADSVRRDREDKHGEYAQAGVTEYWLVEPRPGPRRQPSVTIYHLDAGGTYGLAEPVRSGVLRSVVLPGFWVRAEWLWALPMPSAMELMAEILRYPQGPEGPEAPEGLAVLPWATTLLQQGHAEGEARGRAEGKAEDILAVVRERFDTVPPAVEQRVRATQDIAVLERLLIQALHVTDPADLLTSLG